MRFSSKEHEILTGTVLRIEPATGDMTIRIGGGNDKTDALLSAVGAGRVPSAIKEGDMIRVYVVEVRRSNRGPQVIVSRTHPGLVKRLFELEVPEIASGAVEVKLHRPRGRLPHEDRRPRRRGERRSRSAPASARAARRVGAVVDELHGEKMDIVVWSEDPCQFVASALSPADVVSVTLLPGMGKGVPRHRPGRSALARHRQGGPERKTGRPPDRL